MPQGLLMIDLDQPSYKICAAAAARAGLRPVYSLSTAPLHIAPRAADLSAIILDAENSSDTFAAFSRIEQLFPLTPLLVLTGRNQQAESRLAMRLGARRVFSKPCDENAVEQGLRLLMVENDGHPPAVAASGEGSRAEIQSSRIVCWRCRRELLDLYETRPLADREKRAVLAALKLAGGNKVRAARMLGMGKTTLYRRLRDYRRQQGTEGDMGAD